MTSPQRTIAHYRITAKIGEGGMGEVYKATDTKLGREVAIKVLPSALASDPDRLARFSREAHVLASLNHPNIASLYGVEDAALIMELVEGPTLDQRIAQGPMPVAEARPIVDQLIDALEYAHETGIVHRDLKPANIKITPEGRVKVLDFGLAKALSAEPQPGNSLTSPTLTIRATTPGMIMGTAAYMAPEQARGQDVDKRADIWAFGVIVYEMLTQRQLFAAETVSDTIAQVLTREFNYTGLPDEFVALLQRCLARDRRKRLRDIGDARWLLEYQPATPTLTVSRSKPLVAVVAASILATGVFAVLWWRSSPPPPRALTRFAVGPSASLSPDGGFVFDSSSRPLRIRRLDSVEWQSLPNTERATSAFWSGDSAAIAFLSEGRLRAIPIDGGTMIDLGSFVSSSSGGSWRGTTKDGTILVTNGSQLYTIDVATRKHTELPGRGKPGETLWFPVFLPESDDFVYLVQSQTETALFRSSLASTKRERVLGNTRRVNFAKHPRTGQSYMFFCNPRNTSACDVLAQPVDPRTGELHGRPHPLLSRVAMAALFPSAVFDVADNGAIAWRPSTTSLTIWRLRWLDFHGNILGTIGERGAYTEMSLSPDGNQVAATIGYPESGISIHDIPSGRTRRLNPGSVGERTPMWSADSRTLYYTVETQDKIQVRSQSVVSNVTSELLREFPGSSVRVFLQDVTSDGKYLILFRSSPLDEQNSGFFRIQVGVPVEQATMERLIAISAGGEANPHARLSPDNKWFVYTKGRELFAVKYSSPNSRAVRIGASGTPFFSRDGSILYVTGQAETVSMRVAIATDGTFSVDTPTPLFRHIGPRVAGARTAELSRDGTRILTIGTDQPDLIETQVFNDWTSLLGKSEATK